MDDSGWGVLQFTVILPPRGQARSRAVVAKDRNGNPIKSKETGHFVIIHHKDEKQQIDEEKLQALLIRHKPERPLQGDLLLGMRAYLAIPKSRPRKWQEAAQRGDIRPESRPDLDNILKHIKDCSKGILWGDDAQVVGYIGGTGKYYGTPPRYELTLMFRKNRQIQPCCSATAGRDRI